MLWSPIVDSIAEGITYLARTESIDPGNVLTPLQAASSTHRIAMGPRAGRKVLSLQNTSPVGWVKPITTTLAHAAKLCANAHGFSLHAGVRCVADERRGIEQLCRYITRPAIANERLSVNRVPIPAIGNEGAGLSQSLLSMSTPFIIPMPGKVESLNARSQHLDQVDLNAQIQVMPLYEQFGFEVDGEAFIEASIPHRKMTLHLKNRGIT